MTRDVRRMASKAAFLAVASVCFLAAPCAAGSPPDAGDTTSTFPAFRWGALYSGLLSIERSSPVTPWNDEAAGAGVRDRLVFMGEAGLEGHGSVFLKGATGRGCESIEAGRERLSLDQGHLLFEAFDDRIHGRLFLRERIFRTEHRLLPLLSDDVPFIEGRGEGIRLDLRPLSGFRVRYIESTLRGEDTFDRAGGLPVFHGGGDGYRMVHVSLSVPAGIDVGLFVAQTRSIREPVCSATPYLSPEDDSPPVGDHATIATDVGISTGGIRLMVELARTGDIDDLADTPFFGVDARKLKPNSLGGALSPRTALAAEIHGLEVHAGNAGIAGVLPGYRYHGDDFTNSEGEVAAGIIESYVTAWWLDSRYDLMLTLDGSERRTGSTGESEGRIAGRLHARLKGGLSVGNAIVLAEGDDTTLLLSLLDEREGMRFGASARLDGAGDENDLSFLTESSVHLGDSWLLRTALYLRRGMSSFYHVGLEFRAGRRFLFDASFGSFEPDGSAVGLGRDEEPPWFDKERFVRLFTRVALGEI